MYLFDGSTLFPSSPSKSPSSGGGGGAEAFTAPVVPPISSTYPFMIIIIIAAAVAAAFLFGLIAYCCCCTPMIVPLGKKKKKKKKGGEQEDPSPYTVHSYRGYVDSDDEDAFIIDAPTGEVTKRENHDIKKMMKEEEGYSSRHVPYKVYGPRGYVEGLKAVTYVKQMGSDILLTDARATWNSSPSEASIEDFAVAARSMQHSPGASSYSTVASSHHSTPSNISFVEQAKEQYLQLQEVSSGPSVNSSSSDTSFKSASFVDQAKDQMRRLYKSSPSSSSASIHSSSSATSSSSSFVEQAKAKVQLYKQTREMLKGEYNGALRVQIESSSSPSSSSQSRSLEEEERSIIRSHVNQNQKDKDKDSSGDDSRSTTSSYVEQAKASLLLYRQQVVSSSTTSSSSEEDKHPSLITPMKKSSVNAYNVSALSSDHSNLSSVSVVQMQYSESVIRSTNRTQLHSGPASNSSSSSSSSVIHDAGAVVAQSRARYQALRKDAEKRLSSESNKSSDLNTLNTRDSRSTSDNLNSDSDIFVLSNSTVTVKSSTNSTSSGSIGIYQSHTSNNSSSSSSPTSGTSETRLEVSSSSSEEAALVYDSNSLSIDADLSRSDGSYLDRI